MSEKIRVLIVDDTKQAREHLKNILEENNYIAETASSKEDAIKKFKLADNQKLKYDIVLLDNYLPEKDGGIEVLNYINIKNLDIIAIMISGQMHDETNPYKTGIKAFKAGAIDFLTKPFKKELLLEKINYLINKTKQAEALVELAKSVDISQYKDELENLLGDESIHSKIKNEITKIISENNSSMDSSFLPEPKDIEINTGSSKSHHSMWDKRIINLMDIPNKPRNKIFKIIASHKNVDKIIFGSYEQAGHQSDYKLRIKDYISGDGRLFCSIYGPSPINCTCQNFTIFVESGYEEKVKKDILVELKDFFIS